MSRRRKKPPKRDRSTLRKLSDLTREALIAGMMDPPDMALMERSLHAITDMGPKAIWAAMGGWAELCWVGEEPVTDGEFWGIEALDETTGEAKNPDAIITNASDWGGVNAMRFIVAKANGDWDTMHAIFASPPDAEAAAALMFRVLHLAQQHARFFAEKRAL